ncbi:MAG TPA: NifB/NifX family molybdenum-iron cluster-binding protein [Thermoleophilia bacterium]|nr:NifB/NifX family molybdenum-iron cluster-binding protein [Thermoleophilia bacterium]
MKVAISAQGKDLDALVDPRFGRARWFIIADTETGDSRALDNGANVEASGGAGVQAGSAVAAEGVEAVITGNVGPNAHKVLATAGITIHQVESGVVAREALAAFARGELPALAAPTVSGHWS